jgi:hypothetical protein
MQHHLSNAFMLVALLTTCTLLAAQRATLARFLRVTLFAAVSVTLMIACLSVVVAILGFVLYAFLAFFSALTIVPTGSMFLLSPLLFLAAGQCTGAVMCTGAVRSEHQQRGAHVSRFLSAPVHLIGASTTRRTRGASAPDSEKRRTRGGCGLQLSRR